MFFNIINKNEIVEQEFEKWINKLNSYSVIFKNFKKKWKSLKTFSKKMGVWKYFQYN